MSSPFYDVSGGAPALPVVEIRFSDLKHAIDVANDNQTPTNIFEQIYRGVTRIARRPEQRQLMVLRVRALVEIVRSFVTLKRDCFHRRFCLHPTLISYAGAQWCPACRKFYSRACCARSGNFDAFALTERPSEPSIAYSNKIQRCNPGTVGSILSIIGTQKAAI
jgi:hypothetical protein